MKSVCIIKQRDYAGGGDLEYYSMSKLPDINQLFKHNYMGIRYLFENDIERDKYDIKSEIVDEEVKDRIGDNDSVINFIQKKGKRIKICETSFNDVNTRPFINICDSVDIAVIDPSKNITTLDILFKGKKIFEISDQTRNGNEFINPILVDIENKNIYLYLEKGIEDAKYKAHRFYKVKVIDIELTQ